MSELVPPVVPRHLYDDAVETIDAIHHGRVDAVVVIKGVAGPQVVMLEGADKPYHVLVERMSEGAATVGPDGRILYVNGRLAELTGYPVEYFIHRDLATLFDRGAPALASDESVETNLLRSGNAPLPVKVWTHPISIGDTPATLVTVTDLSIYRRAEEIAAAERFARSILEQATNAIIVLGPDGHITHVSAIAQDLAEQSPLGRTFSQAYPLAQNEAKKGVAERFSEKSLDRLLVTKAFHGVEVKLQNERLAKRTFLLSAGPLLDEKKSSAGAIVTLTEITERKRAEEQQATIAAELNHRVKNILTVVQSLAAQTVRSSNSLGNFKDTFAGRLKALATAHDILMKTNWAGAHLNELLDAVLAPVRSPGEERVSLNGPQILLPVNAVVPLSMAFHELTTNALKYGALSVEGGHVEIGWHLVDRHDQLVELLWQEIGGPRVEARRRSGFGTKLIDRILKFDVDSKIDIIFDPQGLRCIARFRVLPSSTLPVAGEYDYLTSEIGLRSSAD
jgi:two-component sensor histidine kinase/PAS domain-containing protein